MYAVIDVLGSQVRIQAGDRIKVPRMKAESGEKVTLDRVLFVARDGEVRVGAPQLEGATVEATVVGHGKDEKVSVFKMKRRKGYRRKTGHRQQFTELQIGEISVLHEEAKDGA